MNNKELANELNDMLSEFYNTLCNPSKSCVNCEMFKYKKKYSIGGECSALYLATKLLGTTKDTAMFTKKQYEVFISGICKCDDSRYCLNECNMRDNRAYTDLLENRGSCFFIYLGMILLRDI